MADNAQHRTYMLTLKVEEQKHLFGDVVFSTRRENGDYVPADVTVRLTRLGRAIQQAWIALPRRFPGVVADGEELVVMPEHLHGLIHLQDSCAVDVAEVDRIFKALCNKCYKLLLAMGETTPVGRAHEWMNEYNAATAEVRSAMVKYLTAEVQQSLGIAQTQETGLPATPPFRSSRVGAYEKVGFLFSVRYNEVIPVDEEQLAHQRRYIQENPYWRAMRHRYPERSMVTPCATILSQTYSGLEQYLHEQAFASDFDWEAEKVTADMEEVRKGLCVSKQRENRESVCITAYGDAALLNIGHKLPLVCHRADESQRSQQRSRVMEKATQGALIVTAAVSPAERKMVQEVLAAGGRVALMVEHGIPNDGHYHPMRLYRDACVRGQMILLSPWVEDKKPAEKITSITSKSLNCLALALCGRRDDWWKNRAINL